MKVDVIVTSEKIVSRNYDYCIEILESCLMKPNVIVDVKEAMTVAKGTLNPNNGFVIVSPDGTVIKDMYDLVKWIEKEGLRPA